MGICSSNAYDTTNMADGTNISAGQPVAAPGANDTPMSGGGSWSATSPDDRRVLVLEEYTSQGCSSCPPADRWLMNVFGSSNKADQYFRQVIPIAYHVDYWDYLGWPDPWAAQEFSQRQRFIAARANCGTYTPGLFLQGHEFKNWRRTRNLQQLDDASVTQIPVGAPVGRLTFNGTMQNGKAETTFTFEFFPGANEDDELELHAACCTGDTTTKVPRGENHGATLGEPFIARSAIHRERLTKVSGANGQSGSVFEFKTSSLKPSKECEFVMAWVVAVDGSRYLQGAGCRIQSA